MKTASLPNRGSMLLTLLPADRALYSVYQSVRLLLRCCRRKTRPAMWSCLGETERRWRVVRNLRFDVVDSVGRRDLQCGRVAVRQTR